MKYENFSARDFIEDKYFQSWIRCPSTDNNRFWEEYIKYHQHQKYTIEIAREILLYLIEPICETISQEEISKSKKKVKEELGM